MSKTIVLKNDTHNEIEIGTQLEVISVEGNQIIIQVKNPELEEKRAKVKHFIERVREIAGKPIDLSNYVSMSKEEIYKDI